MAMTFDSAFRSIRMLARDREYYISHNIFHRGGETGKECYGEIRKVGSFSSDNWEDVITYLKQQLKEVRGKKQRGEIRWKELSTY